MGSSDDDEEEEGQSPNDIESGDTQQLCAFVRGKLKNMGSQLVHHLYRVLHGCDSQSCLASPSERCSA